MKIRAVFFILVLFGSAQDVLYSAARAGKKGRSGKGEVFSSEIVQEIVCAGNVKRLRLLKRECPTELDRSFAEGNYWQTIIQRRSWDFFCACIEMQLPGINGGRECALESTPLYLLLYGEKGCWTEAVPELLTHPRLNPYVRGEDGLVADDLLGSEDYERAEAIKKFKDALIQNVLEEERCRLCKNGFSCPAQVFILSCGNNHAYHKGCLQEAYAAGKSVSCYCCKIEICAGDIAGLELS